MNRFNSPILHTARDKAVSAVAHGRRRAAIRRVEATLARCLQEVIKENGDKKVTVRLKAAAEKALATVAFPQPAFVGAPYVWYSSRRESWQNETHFKLSLNVRFGMSQEDEQETVSVYIDGPVSKSLDEYRRLENWAKVDETSDATDARTVDEIEALYAQHVELKAQLKAIEDSLGYDFGKHLEK